MNTKKPTIVSCPTCQKQVIWSSEQKFRPFCCERCKLIDLGEWAAEEKVIPGETSLIDSGLDDSSYLH